MITQENYKNLAYRQLLRAHMWNEEELVEFCTDFPNLKYYHNESWGDERRDRDFLQELHNDIVRNSLRPFYNKQLNLDTYRLVMKPNFYLRSENFITNMPYKIFTKLWADPAFELINEYASFSKIIKAKDIEKLKYYHENKKAPRFHKHEMDRSCDQSFFIESLTLAIISGEKDLIELILANQNNRGFRWRSFEASIGEAFKQSIDKLPAGIFPKIKPILEKYVQIKSEIEPLLSAGLGKIVSRYDILTYNIHAVLDKEFKNPDRCDGQKLNYDHFKSFIEGTTKSEDFFIFGSSKQDYIEVTNRMRNLVVTVHECIKNQPSRFLTQAWRDMRHANKHHSESVPYEKAFALLYPHNLNPELYKVFSDEISKDNTWRSNFLARLIECDNSDVFSLIPDNAHFNYHLEHAKIALFFKSYKILEILKTKLKSQEQTELLAFKEQLKDIP